MQKLKTIIIYLALGAGLLSVGCQHHRTRDESKLPWARPASWQNSTPGVGF